MRLIKKLTGGLFLLAILLVIFAAWHLRKDAPVSTDEIYRDDEVDQTKRAVNNFIRIIDETASTHAARGAHAKGHACVKAHFSVEKRLDPILQHGVLSQPGRRYKAWIRFSNASSNVAKSDDRNKDTRGMAIKIIDAKFGENDWLEGSALTQDFLMHSNPVFFAANIEDYNRVVESENKILSFVDGANPFNWRLRELKHALDTLAPPPPSPLLEDYFSNTAYRLGPQNIKFSAQTCTNQKQSVETPDDGPDFLKRALAEHLTTDSACFHFFVQLQMPGKYMPIEDPSVEWKAADSPWRRVATINIPTQEVDGESRIAFCENISFSPWNSLSAHRPLGELNRIRKRVYEASSIHRHEVNNASLPGQLDW